MKTLREVAKQTQVLGAIAVCQFAPGMSAAMSSAIEIEKLQFKIRTVGGDSDECLKRAIDRHRTSWNPNFTVIDALRNEYEDVLKLAVS